MATRLLSCLIALTFVLSSIGPLTAAQPLQPQARDGETSRLLAEPPTLPAPSANATPTADANIAAVLASAIQVAAGTRHTCALTAGGGVKCWGGNYYGQLGDGTTTDRSTPVAVSGLASGVLALTAGGSSYAGHTCALMTGGGVKCWGDNGFGQLGDGTTTNRVTPVAVSGLASGVSAIAAGDEYTCALMTGGGVRCWGINGFGQLGDGTRADRVTPVDVSGVASGVCAIAAGHGHTCALMAGGGVKCWGYNYYGQLGDSTRADRATPVDVSGLASGVRAVAAGLYHTCALTTVGGVKCWGDNDFGQLGDNTTINRSTPVAVSGLASGVRAVAAGLYHTCALTTGGGVKCWGSNYYGQLGDGTTINRATLVDVSGLASGVRAVAVGRDHTCALTMGGGVKCWGYNGFGQLGDGTTTDHATPVAVSGLASGVSALAAGDGHTCALTTDSRVKCWGYNYSNQLGDGTTTNRAVPVDVSGLASGVSAIAAGYSHTCALTADGGVKCWGNNGFGQLGDGTTTDRATPVDVSGLASGVSAIAAGGSYNGSHTCALTTGGGVKCWGRNDYGQLGDGTTTNYTTPVDVSGLASGISAIVAGGYHTCALTAGGGVKCWGDNRFGQLGDGTTTDRATPVAVNGLANGVRAVTVGGSHTCALMTGGGVKCWGHNNSGQLGDGTTGNIRTTPVDVGGLARGVLALAAGGSYYGGHTCALTAGGGVKCWGDNYFGQLGDGTTGNICTTPVDVSGLASGVSAIAAGGSYDGGYTCALTTGGGVKCWGDNRFGQLGVNPGWTPVNVVGFGGGRTIFLPVIIRGSGGGG